MLLSWVGCTVQTVCSAAAVTPRSTRSLCLKVCARGQGPLRRQRLRLHLSCCAQRGGHCFQSRARWASLSGPYLRPFEPPNSGTRSRSWVAMPHPHPLLVLGKRPKRKESIRESYWPFPVMTQRGVGLWTPGSAPQDACLS